MRCFFTTTLFVIVCCIICVNGTNEKKASKNDDKKNNKLSNTISRLMKSNKKKDGVTETKLSQDSGDDSESQEETETKQDVKHNLKKENKQEVEKSNTIHLSREERKTHTLSRRYNVHKGSNRKESLVKDGTGSLKKLSYKSMLKNRFKKTYSGIKHLGLNTKIAIVGVGVVVVGVITGAVIRKAYDHNAEQFTKYPSIVNSINNDDTFQNTMDYTKSYKNNNSNDTVYTKRINVNTKKNITNKDILNDDVHEIEPTAGSANIENDYDDGDTKNKEINVKELLLFTGKIFVVVFILAYLFKRQFPPSEIVQCEENVFGVED